MCSLCAAMANERAAVRAPVLKFKTTVRNGASRLGPANPSNIDGHPFEGGVGEIQREILRKHQSQIALQIPATEGELRREGEGKAETEPRGNTTRWRRHPCAKKKRTVRWCVPPLDKPDIAAENYRTLKILERYTKYVSSFWLKTGPFTNRVIKARPTLCLPYLRYKRGLHNK